MRPAACVRAPLAVLGVCRFPICKQMIDQRANADRGCRLDGGVPLHLRNRSGEILGIAVWFDGIRLFLPGEERTLPRGLVLRASRNIFWSGERDEARMTRNASVFWLSALVISATAGTASAADQAVVLKAAPAKEATEYGNLYYGFDWTSHRSMVGYMGVLYAPYGMDKSGLRVSAFGLGGDYRYHGDPGETFKGRFVSADALIGWSHVFNNGAATVQIGANYQDHRIKPTDPNNSVVGAKTGFKVQGDIWVNPTDRTLVYALASYSTAFNTYYSVGRLGYDFFRT